MLQWNLRPAVAMTAALMLVLVVCGATAWASEDEEETEEQTEEQDDDADDDAEPTYRGDGEQATPLFERAERAFDERDYEEAVRLLEEAFELHEHPLIVYNIGVANGRAQNHEAAIAAYRRYLQICPRGDLITDVYISIGESLLRLRRREEANEAFQHYLDLERDGEYAAQAERAISTGETPADQDRRDPRDVQEARELHERAAELWRGERFQQAAELFIRGYERLPNMHELLYNAALCYLDAQAWADAAATFSRYVRTPGAAYDAWVFMGEAYGECFDYSGAVEAYERYLELEPRGEYAAEAREFVNELYSAEGDETRTETGATPGEVERAQVLYNQALEEYDADQYTESLQHLQEAYEIVQARSLLFNMGICLQAMDRWADALARFEQFLERGELGLSAEAHLEAAECLIELNRLQDAERRIARYLELADEHELPSEESDRERAQELRQRVEGGGSGDDD